MEDFDFTEDEIKEQLDILGYHNVPPERLLEFKRDLEQLVKHEKSKNSSIFSSSEQSSSSESDIQRGRHYTHLNDVARSGLDPSAYRQTSVSNGQISDHRNVGKENIYLAAPTQQSESGRLDSVSGGPLRDYSLYRETASAAHTEGQADGQQASSEVDTTLDSTTSTERRIMKRKVLRKKDGHAQVYETESESDDLASLQERLRSLPISVHVERPATAPGHRPSAKTGQLYPRPQSAREAPVYRLPEDYEGPTALIRPMSQEPNRQHLKKTDPVSRYHQYNSSWQSHRAPGEKNHKGLRWGVREQMLYHDEVVTKKQPKVFIPNNYSVPSDKKRKNLRWQIRNDLAQGVVPPSMYD